MANAISDIQVLVRYPTALLVRLPGVNVIDDKAIQVRSLSSPMQ